MCEGMAKNGKKSKWTCEWKCGICISEKMSTNNNSEFWLKQNKSKIVVKKVKKFAWKNFVLAFWVVKKAYSKVVQKKKFIKIYLIYKFFLFFLHFPNKTFLYNSVI